jgi:hypothetical protein
MFYNVGLLQLLHCQLKCWVTALKKMSGSVLPRRFCSRSLVLLIVMAYAVVLWNPTVDN